MTCRPCKGCLKFLFWAKDGSIHQTPICDMVPEGYRHRPDNGLLGLRILFYL